MAPTINAAVQLGLPKGRMEQGILSLMADAGIRLRAAERTYRPAISLPGFEAKILKPQNIVQMLHIGSRDVGFAGCDWVEELGADLIELLDTGLDPVRLVAAAPPDLRLSQKSVFIKGASAAPVNIQPAGSRRSQGRLLAQPPGRLVIASEYENITMRWIERRRLDAVFVRSNGATEVFPPEDADCIVDNTASGETLRANNLEIVEELMTSSTRLYANPDAMKNGTKREAIEHFVLLLSSVLDARKRVMLEVNVSSEKLEAVVAAIPAMKEPTISQLHGGSGFAVKGAVLKSELPRIIPKIKAAGGSDLIVMPCAQIVP